VATPYAYANRGLEKEIQMIKEFNLPIDEVVKKLNIKKDELLEYMKGEK